MRTRANPNVAAQDNGVGRGNPGGGRGNPRGGRGNPRGGRGGRGGGRGGPGGGLGHAENPDLATVIAEQLAAAMPTIVEQVTAAMGRAQNQNQGGAPEVVIEPEQENQEQEGFNPEVEFVGNGVYVGPGPRRFPRNNEYAGERRGCSYTEFKKCGPPDYNGKGGAGVFMKLLEKLEAVMDISECPSH